VGFLLEFDTGTEVLARLVAIIEPYARLRRDSGPDYAVLFVQPNPTCETNLHRRLNGHAARLGITVATAAARSSTPGPRRDGGIVSGSRVTFLGDVMSAVVQGVSEVRTLIGQPPVIVGGLAVLARLSTPYRATVDLDVVDRLAGQVSQLEVLRAADGAQPVEPAAVLLPTLYGVVKVDVLQAGHRHSRHRAPRARSGDWSCPAGSAP
jgi:hypothetical protein